MIGDRTGIDAGAMDHDDATLPRCGDVDILVARPDTANHRQRRQRLHVPPVNPVVTSTRARLHTSPSGGGHHRRIIDDREDLCERTAILKDLHFEQEFGLHLVTSLSTAGTTASCSGCDVHRRMALTVAAIRASSPPLRGRRGPGPRTPPARPATSVALQRQRSHVRIVSGAPTSSRSVPDTWVTVYTGDIGNTLVVSCHRRALTKPPARYGAKGARFASGFVSRRSCIRTRDGIQ
jgi:hypothetical protein